MPTKRVENVVTADSQVLENPVMEPVAGLTESQMATVISDVEVLPAESGDGCGSKPEPRAWPLPGTAWKPGQSGNPSGRRRQDPAIIKLLKDNTLGAAQTLVELMTDIHISPKIRCQAAEAILDRVYGKAVQPIDATVGGTGDPVMIVFGGVLEKWSQ